MHILLVCSLVLFPALSESRSTSQDIDLDDVYILITMYKQIFSDAGVKIEDGKEFDIFQIVKEMDALKKAGMDYTVPFKAAGMDSLRSMTAIDNFDVAYQLMRSGIDWKTSLAALDHALAASVSFNTIFIEDRPAKALQYGLKAGGQDIEIKKIQETLKLARVLKDAGILPNSAYKASQIDIGIIPVDTAKYQAVFDKIKAAGIPWSRLSQ